MTENVRPPDKRYRRPPAAAEIDALPALDSSAFFPALEGAKEPETVIYAIRRLRAEGRGDECERLAELLLDPSHRAHQIMARHAWRLFRTSESDRKEHIQATTVALWELIADPSPRGDFAHHNAFDVIAKLASNAARTMKRQRGEWDESPPGQPKLKKVVSLDQLAATVGGEAVGSEDQVPVDDDILDGVTTEALIHRLPSKVARAVVLKQSGFAVQSKDPNERTIATIIGVDPRTIQNYFAIARTILSADRG